MKKCNSQKGITLIALGITISVIFTLTALIISTSINDGIIGKTKNSVEAYENAQEEEKNLMEKEKENIDKNVTPIIKNNKGKNIVGQIVNVNTEAWDQYSNKIVVPVGFKIAVDGQNVPDGVVIEDEDGNQFVWVPVGTIYEDKDKTSFKTITLAKKYTSYYDTKARNIEAFKKSVAENGGYYIGRYEASISGNIVECKGQKTAHVNLTRNNALNLAQGMYFNGYETGTFSSDLINSYAWDTAVDYIQKLSKEPDASNYASLNKSKSLTLTGDNKDEYCNINDMSGNVREWTTETHRNPDYPCIFRGGYYKGYAAETTKSMNYWRDTYKDVFLGFRPILYLAV